MSPMGAGTAAKVSRLRHVDEWTTTAVPFVNKHGGWTHLASRNNSVSRCCLVDESVVNSESFRFREVQRRETLYVFIHHGSTYKFNSRFDHLSTRCFAKLYSEIYFLLYTFAKLKYRYYNCTPVCVFDPCKRMWSWMEPNKYWIHRVYETHDFLFSKL